MAGLTQCEDFLMFQRALKQLRECDDKIIYALNMSTPTVSMRARGGDPEQNCKLLQNELEQNYSRREERITACVSELSERLTDMKNKGENFRPLQNNIRLMKNELNVEEIIRDQSRKMFDRKCKEYL